MILSFSKLITITSENHSPSQLGMLITKLTGDMG
jgi:hypothetical protein